MKGAGDKKMSKTVSTKLTAEDYELCQKIARQYYIDRKIKTPSVSELTRFALAEIFDVYRSPTVIRAPHAPEVGGQK
jgi:hypothetical protein